MIAQFIDLIINFSKHQIKSHNNRLVSTGEITEEYLNYLSLILLEVAMFLLLNQMRKYHQFEYHFQKNSIFYFMFFEIFGSVLPVFGAFVGQDNFIVPMIEMALHSGLYPMIQAFGKFILKKLKTRLKEFPNLIACSLYLSTNVKHKHFSQTSMHKKDGKTYRQKIKNT